MTNSEFRHVQDVVLQLSNKALSDALKVSPTSVSLWRSSRAVPDYIQELLEHLQAQKVRDLTVSFTLSELTAASRRAFSMGKPFDEYLMDLIRADIRKHTLKFPTEEENPLPTTKPAPCNASLTSSPSPPSPLAASS